jgi:SH3-like domain-containing protein
MLLAGAFALARANMTFAAGDKDLPLPRFASLRSDQVNLRTGPGERYPVEWVLTHKGLPVEILAEYQVWRKIIDWQGTIGWVHERMLAGARSVMVAGQLRVLHADPDAAAAPVARAEPGVIARLLSCAGAWCRIEAQGIRGWLPRGEIWGVLPDETVE